MIHKVHDPTWHLKDTLLKNTKHKIDIESAPKQYLIHNPPPPPDMSPLTLWEAHKSVLCGSCLRQVALFNRERKTLCSKLEADFNTCYMVF